ncbi:MAG: hypothetical protein PHY45_10615 [Rhodocyclaceae bacterium]|nr:hypothetical protein [Rhodocyclaceae bacterium]
MLRRLSSALVLAAWLASVASALSGCVVVPYDDEGYHYDRGYHGYDEDHDYRGHHRW